MGMPTIPEEPYRPSREETIIDLLESIALEELAIAHIMNAEGEKVQEVVKRYSCGHICADGLHRSCRDAQSMMNSLIMKEWLLFTKLNTVLDIQIEERVEARIKEKEPKGCVNSIRTV